MQKQIDTKIVGITRFIEVDPDKLIEIGYRIKQAAMDESYPGQSITHEFSNDITLIYHPEREFCKPLHRSGQVLIDTPSVNLEGITP